MKKLLIYSASVLLGYSLQAQGTLQIDQQCTSLASEFDIYIQGHQPLGQSFVPTLSSIDFVNLNFYDSGSLSVGATLYVNLRADTLTGTILGATLPISVPNNFFGITNFAFSTSIILTPGQTYFFEPVVQSGDGINLYSTTDNYPQGTYIVGGNPQPGYNMWFQEGIFVPEPSVVSLLFLGGAFVWLRRRKF